MASSSGDYDDLDDFGRAHYEDGLKNEGMMAYGNGDYKVAAFYLKGAARYGHHDAQSAYADICFRNLDGKVRHRRKAAFWYITAAENDLDVCSYLRSEVHTMFNDDNYVGMTGEEKLRKQMSLLIDAWNSHA